MSNNSRVGIVSKKAQFLRETIEREGQFWRPSESSERQLRPAPQSRTWTEMKFGGVSLSQLKARQRELRAELSDVCGQLDEMNSDSRDPSGAGEGAGRDESMATARSQPRTVASEVTSNRSQSGISVGSMGTMGPLSASQYSSVPFRRAADGGVMEAFTWGGSFATSSRAQHAMARQTQLLNGAIHAPRPGNERRGMRNGMHTRAFDNPVPVLRPLGGGTY